MKKKPSPSPIRPICPSRDEALAERRSEISVEAGMESVSTFITSIVRKHPLQGCTPDDIAQDVAVVLLQQLGNQDAASRFPNESAFRGWLYNVTRNTVVGCHRSARHFRYCDSIDLEVELGRHHAFEFSHNAEHLIDKDELSRYEHEVERLEDRERGMLRDQLEGKSTREISERYGVPGGTVRSCLSRARQKLKARLQD